MDNSNIQYYRGLIRQLETNLTNALKRIEKLESVTETQYNAIQQGITPSQSVEIPTDWVQLHDHSSETQGGELDLEESPIHDHTGPEQGGLIDFLNLHDHSSSEQGGPAYAIYYPG